MFVQLVEEELIGERVWAAGSVIEVSDDLGRILTSEGNATAHQGPASESARGVDYKPDFPSSPEHGHGHGHGHAHADAPESHGKAKR